ncbi:hypothetical protein [Methylobacterium sp. WL120]|uniref:hypothetical protein n=1 Tax=Methylobacterium sp. WL120 TaxID=2603887 RepID=UPI0011C77324|nr:hypothetical protein [Methylobacterium sp. WL120]TXM68306.1 hypothetical protein FV229_08020 [Methylobacterium sp. WL120]
MIKLFLASLPGGGVLVAIWSFLTSTIGMVLVASAIAYGAGYSAADHKADLKRLEAEVATLKADQRTSEGARILAEKQSGSLEANLRQNQEKYDVLKADLAKRRSEAAKKPGSPTRDCGLSSSDLNRLRDIGR